MQKVLFWVRARAGMSGEEFRRYWIETHVPLLRAGFARLRRCNINIVTGTIEGDPSVHGVAELYWDDRESALGDLSSPAGRIVLNDVPNFADEAGPLFADELSVV